MRDELFLPREHLGADLAGVRLVARVLLQVVREVLLASKRLLAEVATVWRLTRVNSVAETF